MILLGYSTQPINCSRNFIICSYTIKLQWQIFPSPTVNGLIFHFVSEWAQQCFYTFSNMRTYTYILIYSGCKWLEKWVNRTQAVVFKNLWHMLHYITVIQHSAEKFPDRTTSENLIQWLDISFFFGRVSSLGQEFFSTISKIMSKVIIFCSYYFYKKSLNEMKTNID